MAKPLAQQQVEAEKVRQIRQVVGDLNDVSFGGGTVHNPTLVGHARANYYHVHDAAKIYPVGADPVTITASSGDPWEHGEIAQVIPAEAIKTKFDIHWILIGSISAVDDYELKLWKGEEDAEELIATVAFARSANFSQEGDIPVQVAPIDANTRIGASLACGDGDGATCTVKLYYHTYPDIT